MRLRNPYCRALPYNPTTEMGQSLLRTALILQKEQAPPPPNTRRYKIFMTEFFGHRAICAKLTLVCHVGVRTQPIYWKFYPHILLRTIWNLKIEQFRTAQLEAESAIPRIDRGSTATEGVASCPVNCSIVALPARIRRLSEQPKFDMNQCFALLRRVLVKVGQDLVEQGRLNHAEDVFYVSLADIRSDKDLRAYRGKGANSLQQGSDTHRGPAHHDQQGRKLLHCAHFYLQCQHPNGHTRITGRL